MKGTLFFYFLFMLPVAATSQALEDINYGYLYQTASPFTFTLTPVRTANEWIILFELKLADGTRPVDEYTVQWEARDNLKDKVGRLLNEDSAVTVEMVTSGAMIRGRVRFPQGAVSGVINARVVDLAMKQVWYYPLLLRSEYPVNSYLVKGDSAVMKKYLAGGEPVSVEGMSGGTPAVVSYYSDDFPAAAPAFSEALARVSGTIMPDSTFRVSVGQEVRFSENGMYLIQQDTGAVQGLAFRVHDDYPKYGKLENLIDPLVYICTRQEFDRLNESRGEKRQFDRMILTITGDAERAKIFMRNYFRRVEEANEFFSSYKEGWKTDRGMIYIVFGNPEEVFQFEDREVWNYDNGNFKINFSFIRSPTLFDPDNFVLIRQRKYLTTWYEVIDLWRNSRF